MRKYLFTGLALLLPVALTLMIIIFLFNFFTAPFVPIVTDLLTGAENNLSITLPEGLNTFIARVIALFLLCAFVLLLGVIARWFLVRHLIQGTHSMLSRIPLLKTIFKVSRDVFATLFSNKGKKAFDRPVMIPFPFAPTYSVGFVAGDVPEECQRKSPEPLISVFAPTAPHPISGFLFLVPEKDIREIDMTNEDVIKFLVSCGVIVPDEYAPS